MKKYILGIASLLIASSVYSYTGEPHYNVKDNNQLTNGFEDQSYDNLLRFVDSHNEQIGDEKRYFKGKTRFVKNAQDTIDLVPVAQITWDDGGNEWSANLGTRHTESNNLGYTPINSLVESGKGAINKELLKKLAFQREGNYKRFYFGNKNTVNDIIIEDTKKFNKSIKEVKKEKQDKYLLLGEYRRVGKKSLDALNISIDEYKTDIKGKSQKEVATFLKNKLEKYMGETLKQDGANLYSVVNGKKWKIYWDIQPYTEVGTAYGDEIPPLIDKVFADVYKYETFVSPDNSAGKVIYTKNNNIIVEDRLSQKKEIKIGQNGTLDEIIATSKKGGYFADPKFKQYFKDKESMSKEDFEKKWVIPFEKGGEFEKDLEAMNKELKPISEKIVTLKKDKEILDNRLKKIETNSIFPKDWYIYVDMNNLFSQEEKDKVYNSKTKEQQKLLDEYKELSPKSSKLYDDISDLEIMEQSTIPKKYGFSYDGKWKKLVVPDSSMTLRGSAINVEFRGDGRVEGTVDLGEGSNRLKIAEEPSGKYDANIILGAKAKLKNIDIIKIGRSISGRSTLTLDIDPKIKNKKGNLIQHALRDSDSDIKFVNALTNIDDTSLEPLYSRNDFSIDLMTSKINENSVVDMGRNLNYKIRGLDTHTTITPDSIATSISEKNSSSGNTLLNIKIKDKIKRLSDKENEAYRSIKNASKIVALQPTLTTTNKKTFFTSYEDDVLKAAKKKKLIVGLKYDSAKDIYKNVSQFNLNNKLKKDMIKKIEILKNTQEVQNSIEKSRQFKEMSSLKEFINLKSDINNKFKTIDDLDKKINFVEATSNFGSVDKEKLADEMIAMTGTLNTLDIDTLENLGNKYDKIELLKTIEDKVKTVKEKMTEYNISKDNNKLKSALETLKDLRVYMQEFLVYDNNKIDDELVKTLNEPNFGEKTLFNEVNYTLFYTIKEEEVLSELKTILNQMENKNIYSKLNKIAKNEISTYTNLPFDINHDLFKDMKKNKHYAKGGFISSRTVQDNFKGNTYTSYGLYENKLSKNDTLGFMIGGTNTDFQEIHPRKMNYVATESTIKGVSAYMGAYLNKKLVPNLNWISGTGIQYGKYKINRQLKNNYQEFTSKGKTTIEGINTYTGLVVNYPVHEDVSFQVKGILSHTFLNQNRIMENEGLPLNIYSQQYNYIDGELGVALTKTLFDYDVKSSLSAGVYGVAGLYGYKNKDLTARVKDSSSSFNIAGDKIKKDALKIFIDYNVQEETGFNYGLSGTYLTNSEENNVKIGVKAGYVF